MKGWVVGSTKNHKAKMIITGPDVDYLMRMPDGSYQPIKNKGHVPGVNTIRKAITIPCGKCLECRLQYARTWADRCMMEAQLHESNYFLTLTYDDEHVPVTISNSDGEFMSSLCKKDFQDFMKRLRKATGQKLRYFACGEYGSKTKRPHYHAIIFGLQLDDLVEYSRNYRGDSLYNSEFLNNVWKKGYVVVGECNYDSACYTARYVVKKALNDESDVLEDLGFEKEFVLMSRNPGIGKEFYEQNKEKFRKFGEVYLPTDTGNIRIVAPRYFNNFLAEEFPDDYYHANRMRDAVGEAAADLALSQTSKDIVGLGSDREYVKTSKMSALRREL